MERDETDLLKKSEMADDNYDKTTLINQDSRKKIDLYDDLMNNLLNGRSIINRDLRYIRYIINIFTRK